MITASEAKMLNPKSHALSDELRQIGYAIEEATKKGDWVMEWELKDKTVSISDVERDLRKLGYHVFTTTKDLVIISWW